MGFLNAGMSQSEEVLGVRNGCEYGSPMCEAPVLHPLRLAPVWYSMHQRGCLMVRGCPLTRPPLSVRHKDAGRENFDKRSNLIARIGNGFKGGPSVPPDFFSTSLQTLTLPFNIPYPLAVFCPQSLSLYTGISTIIYNHVVVQYPKYSRPGRFVRPRRRSDSS